MTDEQKRFAENFIRGLKPVFDALYKRVGALEKQIATLQQAAIPEVTHDGERTFALTWRTADRIETQTFTLPVVIYRGTWKEGQYDAGDQVTWNGAQWTARSATTARPGLASDESRAWTLSAKAGRDGRDGKNGRDAQSPGPGPAAWDSVHRRG